MIPDANMVRPPRPKTRETIARLFAPVPLLAWLAAALAAVVLEYRFGEEVADLLGLPKIPVLFGLLIALKDPQMIPGAMAYVAGVYIVPTALIARLVAPAANPAARWLLGRPMVVPVAVHLGLVYAVLHVWTDVSAYQLVTVKLTLIAVMLTLSLNLINGYMGEFSCSHPAFMALGAYAGSVFTLVLFVNDRVFGKAWLAAELGPWFFPLALIAAGAMAAIGALFIAIPSFKTRGDYLAVISLAFLFIVKSLVENMEIIGGPRGLGSQPDYASLPVVFAWTVICVWMITNFVTSILGKALNAVRDNEPAAEAMTVNTRRTKIVGFLFGAFWAGVAGGLYAHVIRYINPGTFSLQSLADMLAMVYFGGLNSVWGSILGAVSLNLLSEALRPLEIFKWIIIPLLLILMMIFRPTGLIAFKEFDVKKLMSPKS
jgi:branched-chain amino acid transport system permease protein